MKYYFLIIIQKKIIKSIQNYSFALSQNNLAKIQKEKSLIKKFYFVNVRNIEELIKMEFCY